MGFPTTAVLVSAHLRPGRRGKGYAQMRKEFRELFDSNVRGEKSAVRVLRACVEDDTAPWDQRLKAIELAARYGFGMPERMDDEQILVLAEKKMEARVAEARLAITAMEEEQQ